MAIAIGYAAVDITVIQLQINLTVQLLIGVFHCDKQVANDVCDVFCYIFLMCIFFQFVNVILLITYKNE